MRLVILFITNFVFVCGILGGYNIKIRDAPFQVNYGDACGGVLIHKKWALTTAHCGTNHSYIRIGSSYRLKGPQVNIIRHIIHPMYGLKHKFDFDIQLLELFHGLHFSKLVSSIPISGGESVDNIFVTGWGYPKEKGEYRNVLQEVKMAIVPMTSCQVIDKAWYNGTLTSRMFCAGGGERDACQGDSGGAAVAYGKLVGLSSFGFGCGREIPGVYTNVSHSLIRKWIYFYTGV